MKTNEQTSEKSSKKTFLVVVVPDEKAVFFCVAVVLIFMLMLHLQITFRTTLNAHVINRATEEKNPTTKAKKKIF